MTTATGQVAGGQYFEDLSEGQAVTSGYSTITEQDIDDFVRLSGDANPLHLDDAKARQLSGGKLRGRIAHGALVFSRATGLAWQSGLLIKATAFFSRAEMDFIRAVYPGDSIKIEMKIIELISPDEDDRRQLGTAKLSVHILNQRNKTVQSDIWTAAVTLRPK